MGGPLALGQRAADRHTRTRSGRGKGAAIGNGRPRQGSDKGAIAPWLSVAALLLLAVGAGLGSAVTAPRPASTTAPTTTAPLPATTIPETSCPTPAGSPSITLSDMLPNPAVTITVDTILVAVVPPWPGETATAVHIVNPIVLSQTCTVLLPDGGRRTLLYAVSAGHTLITATVTPPTMAAMPAWEASVTVTGRNRPPPAGALSSVIALPSTTLVAGSTVNGALVVTNHTNGTINISTGCKPFWQVGLQSPTMPFRPVEPAICELAPFLLAPGENRLPFQLEVPSSFSPGSYQAVLVSQSPSLTATPVDVEVVAASG